MSVKLPEDLLERAKAACGNAYAPYSNYQVGCALRSDDGTIFAGANVENASYGLSRCAEQAAVAAMTSAGARKFSELVVYSQGDDPAAPCGACRQVLVEFSPEAQVYIANPDGLVAHYKVSELLPMYFRLSADTS